jgi:adenylate cyclase
MPSPPPPPPTLQQRAWLAFLVQELTAPAAHLSAHADSLLNALGPDTDPSVLTLARRIHDRTGYLQDTVRKLASAEIAPHTEAELKTLRHDLRGAAGYVISACDSLEEEAADLGSPLTATRSAARRLLELLASLGANAPNTEESGFALPILNTLETLPAAVRAARAEKTEPGRVLLVDDNEYNRDLVGKMLRDQGHAVEAVDGGPTAMARLSRADAAIDVVLCDVLMPGVTGLDLLRWLKAHPTLWAVPVIMVSSLGDEDGVLACIAAGAEDYLTRPVRPELLRARIAACLEKKRLRDREQEYQSRIDRLVNAMFPPAAVTEWKRHEAICPKRHEKVGVLFTDIAGFTSWCEARQDRPEEVVATLQDLISRFEASAARYGVQKIKTVGDAFMAVAGLDGTDPNPALSLLECGLALIADAAAHPANWKVRVGVNVGPVVSGVLGQTQFSFDVWGHTVNAAARMESSGIPGRVTLSEVAWADVAAVAVGAPRRVEVKGLGATTVWDFVRFKT